MRLLLFLSALIAGLSGLMTGQPSVARARVPAAIAVASSDRTEQVREAVELRQVPANLSDLTPSAGDAAGDWVDFTPQQHPVDERRIE